MQLRATARKHRRAEHRAVKAGAKDSSKTRRQPGLPGARHRVRLVEGLLQSGGLVFVEFYAHRGDRVGQLGDLTLDDTATSSGFATAAPRQPRAH